MGHRHIVHADGGKEPGSADRVLPGAHDEEAGMAAARLLLAEDTLPTAIVAANDRCAIGLLHTFGRAGLEFPHDISIVGFDDNHLSHLSHIDLTTSVANVRASK